LSPPAKAAAERKRKKDNLINLSAEKRRTFAPKLIYLLDSLPV
jgi:hypothetical protein